jgi:hypothetical protein
MRQDLFDVHQSKRLDRSILALLASSALKKR